MSQSREEVRRVHAVAVRARRPRGMNQEVKVQVTKEATRMTAKKGKAARAVEVAL